MENVVMAALEVEAQVGKKDFDCLVDYISVLDIRDEHYRLCQFQLGNKYFVGVEIDQSVEVSAPLVKCQIAKVAI